MQAWAVQDAKSRFSEFLDACLEQGPQVVTRRGVEEAVLVPVEVWRRLQVAAKPSLKDLLLSDIGRGDLVLPKRGQARRRNVQEIL
ncbi:type II toxin-antitoxin system Phd/YefM family antitoxin [Thiofilum flexile]|uniref:type II toxin-antitoxin system Phd/YefM family antitoxin n=1 Tax=Thiofilum flexile TaxID=125627 RepID=UPI00037AC875|nr:type II toxin-antitoxin system Phd/YefM family antitoxin [Thiofilum flexile]